MSIYNIADYCGFFQQLVIFLNIIYNSDFILSLLQVDVFALPATRGRSAIGRAQKDSMELAASRYALNGPYVEPSCVGPIWSDSRPGKEVTSKWP